MMVLNISLFTEKVKLVNHYVLSYLRCFENGGKNMFFIKDDDVGDKYSKIWDKIKEKLNIKFHSIPVYDETYIKTKVREFNGMIKTNFLGGKVPKENMPYTCIACITIDSVMRMQKKNYLQVYLEEFKCRGKKIKMYRFRNIELKIGFRIRIRIRH